MSKKTMERFESLNQLVDEVVPKLSNAEAVLLLYYWRHAKLVGQGDFRRNAFRVSDGRAASDLAKSRQTIRKQRLSLMGLGVVNKIDRAGKLPVWIIERCPQMGEAPVNQSDSASEPK